MRKIFIILITVILLITSGCSTQPRSENDVSQKPKAEESNNLEDNSNIMLYDYEESYNMSSTESIFQKKMRGNLIDRHYHNEFSRATTTAEFCELQKKYIDIWKNELDFAVDKFNNILTPTDKEDFFQIQKAWESSTLDQINFERDYIISCVTYCVIGGGSSFDRFWISETYKTILWCVGCCVYIFGNRYISKSASHSVQSFPAGIIRKNQVRSN